jgi:hypothetical protein
MTETIQALQVWTSELERLEDAVRRSDKDGVRARWESGRHLLTLRGGKRYRRGELAALSKGLGVHRSELTARVKFATKFSTDEALTNVISQFGTWFAIKQQALTDTPREQAPTESEPEDEETTNSPGEHQTGSRSLQRVLTMVENLDPATFGEDDDDVLALIAERIERLREAIDTLRAA